MPRRAFGQVQPFRRSSRDRVEAERFSHTAIAAGLTPLASCLGISVRSCSLHGVSMFPMQHFLPKMVPLVFERAIP